MIFSQYINFYFSVYIILFVSIIKSQNLTTTTSTTTSTTTTITTTSTATTTTTISTTPTILATGCNLSQSSKHESDLLEKLKPLNGEKFSWKDEDHYYYFSICSKAENANKDDQGFVQINQVNKNLFVLGRLNDVDLEGLEGPMTLFRLKYNNGDRYANACGKSERAAVVYIGCSNQTSFRMIEENNERDNKNCAYIFELMTPKICTANSTVYCNNCDNNQSKSSTSMPNVDPKNKDVKKGLGIFSVVLISLGSLLFVYLVFGSLYLRFVRSARGWEQIPNFRLWNGIGNKMADCCNYVCRCGQRPTEIHSYDNINDRMSDDDNLLNF